MSKALDGLSKIWATFMEYNKAFDGTLFIVLVFITLWKILNLLTVEDLPEDSLRILTEYASVFSHILSAVCGALFMKAAIDLKNGNGHPPKP